MRTRSSVRRRFAVAALATLAFTTGLPAQQLPGKFPGGCAEPPKRPSETGCYLSAILPIEKRPDAPLFCHLHSYPSLAAAEAAKADSLSVVAESLDKVWLFTLAPQNGGPPMASGWRSLARYRCHVQVAWSRDLWRRRFRQARG